MVLLLAALAYLCLLCLWGGTFLDESLLGVGLLLALVIIALLGWPPRLPWELLPVLAAGGF